MPGHKFRNGFHNPIVFTAKTVIKIMPPQNAARPYLGVIIDYILTHKRLGMISVDVDEIQPIGKFCHRRRGQFVNPFNFVGIWEQPSGCFFTSDLQRILINSVVAPPLAIISIKIIGIHKI